MDRGGLFLGVDAGAKGAAAVISGAGEYVEAWRWRSGRESEGLAFLRRYGPEVQGAYIEQVQIFRQLPINVVLNMQALLVNMGLWQGLFIAAGLRVDLIKPVSWQAKIGAPKKDRWRYAAAIFPAAGIKGPADDGRADALLIAEAARVDYLAGLQVQESLSLAFLSTAGQGSRGKHRVRGV